MSFFSVSGELVVCAKAFEVAVIRIAVAISPINDADRNVIVIFSWFLLIPSVGNFCLIFLNRLLQAEYISA
jgi:hypothetical protein